MLNLPANLPSISAAKLPVVYTAAVNALAECSRIDECQQWADKAEALASYAKQANDESMRKMADRIQARAIRRCGELLKQVPVNHDRGNQHRQREGDHPQPTRTEVAEQAGLSEHQRKTAIRVANVRPDDFERQIESETPPTVTALAEQGKKPLLNLGDSTPADFKLATAALATLRRFAEFADSTDPQRVAAGVQPSEAAKVRQHVATIDAWLDRFITSIGG